MAVKDNRHSGGGLNKYRDHFSKQEDFILLQMHARGHKIADVAERLGRTYTSVKARANRRLKIYFKFPPRRAA